MHAYFLRAGDYTHPIIYEAEAIRDGGSFTTRRVVARQHGKAIFFSSRAFKEKEAGMEHQLEMPTVAGPEQLESDRDYWNRMPPEAKNNFSGKLTAIDSRSLNRREPGDRKPRDPVQGQWFKACGAIAPGDPMHEVLVAFYCDMALLGAALRPHPVDVQTAGLQVTSLDHSIWFHAPMPPDDWLYYHMDSPRSSNGTGLNRGSIYSRAGTLVASVSQEGLMRLKQPKPPAASEQHSAAAQSLKLTHLTRCQETQRGQKNSPNSIKSTAILSALNTCILSAPPPSRGLSMCPPRAWTACA
jgi:acyl-CoA thioesterase-2